MSLDSQHGGSVGILRILGVLFTGTPATSYATTQIREANAENVLGKTNLHFTVILEATLHKESV